MPPHMPPGFMPPPGGPVVPPDMGTPHPMMPSVIPPGVPPQFPPTIPPGGYIPPYVTTPPSQPQTGTYHDVCRRTFSRAYHYIRKPFVYVKDPQRLYQHLRWLTRRKAHPGQSYLTNNQ